jgi:hypothetical protein
MAFKFNPFTGTLDEVGTSSGGGTPGGSTTQVQFNDAGAFGGSVDLTFASATGTLSQKYGRFTQQATAPSTPANGYTFYANSSNALSWKGANGYIRTFDGTSNTADRSYTLPDANGNLALVAGATTQLMFNDGGTLLGGDADLVWNKTTNVLGVTGDVNLIDGGTYTTTLQTITPTAARTISLPDATGTVALVAGSSGQLIYNNAGAYAGGPLFTVATGTFGYTTGGTVTQGTNKSTAVTLNGASGRITMNSASLSLDTTVSFTLTNSSITVNDLLILNHVSGGTAGSYLLNAQAAAGSATINVRNITAGILSEAIVIGFAIIKA